MNEYAGSAFCCCCFTFFVFVIVRLQPEYFFLAVLHSIWSDWRIYRCIRNASENTSRVAVIKSVWCKVFTWFQCVPQQDDVNLTIYEKIKSAKDYSRPERETLLYNTLILLKEETPDKSLINTFPPCCFKENTSSDFDTNKLKSVNDILASQWHWDEIQQRAAQICYTKDGEKYLRVGPVQCNSTDVGINVHQHSNEHKSVKDFRNTITFLTSISENKMLEESLKLIENIVFC